MTAVTRGEKPFDTSRSNLRLFIVGAMLLVALALRLYGLNSGLWYDEILTSINYARMPFGEIIATYDSQNQHFLFSLLSRASTLIFGESAWALRLPAVVFGVASIWALYLLGREVGSETEALLSAALLTFSYHHVWFSQNARGYTGLLFWAILSSWYFLRGLREGRSRLWVLYAGAAALGIYTHMTMIFVIIGQFIVYLTALVNRRHAAPQSGWRGLFLGFGFAGLFTLLLLAPALPQILYGGSLGEVSTVSAWKHPLWTLLEIIRGIEIGFAGGVFAVGALAVFGAGMWDFARTKPALIGLFFIPVILCAAVVIALGHHLWPRFFFFAFGFGVLIAVRGATVLGRWLAKIVGMPAQAALLGIVAGVGLVFVSALSVPFAYGPKQDYAGALAFVQQERQPGDAVVTVGLATFPYQRLYQVDWTGVESLEALNDIRLRAKRTWLLYTFPPELESVYPDIVASIRRDFQVVKEFPGTVGEGAIIVCRSDVPPGQVEASSQ